MPKMCPYNRAREVQRYKQKNELDESGNISSYAYEMRVDFIPLPCTGEECGAWRDGACRYASVNLDNKHGQGGSAAPSDGVTAAFAALNPDLKL